MGRDAEAAEDARHSLAVARAHGYPVAEALALAVLSLSAGAAGDWGSAVQLARQAEQIAAGRPGPTARVCSQILTTVLIEADDLGAAGRVCATGLAGARDAGDLWSQGSLLEKMVVLDLNAGRYEDAAAHLNEGLHITLRSGLRADALDYLDCCGYLCAMTGRCAEAVTVWAAVVALQGHDGLRVPSHPDLPRGWYERQEPLREARQALGPDRARTAEERGQAMSLATAAEYVLMLTAAFQATARRAGPGPAQRPGTGTGHPDRPGTHQRADRCRAVHQRAHGQLPPGPHPRQDRLPPPRRPHPARADLRPGLAQKGLSDPAPGTSGRRAWKRAGTAGPFRPRNPNRPGSGTEER